MDKILIIAVTYNTPEETVRFLKSIEGQNYEGVKVVLVDNSDQDSKSSLEEKIKEIKVNVTFLKTGVNLGYFGAADKGLNAYMKTTGLPEWMIVSNIDLVFDQPGFFEMLDQLRVPASL